MSSIWISRLILGDGIADKLVKSNSLGLMTTSLLSSFRKGGSDFANELTVKLKPSKINPKLLYSFSTSLYIEI